MNIRYIAIPITMLVLAVLTLAAFSTPASAGVYGDGCSYDNWYNGTVNGSIYFDLNGSYDTGANYTFENVPDNRTIERIYSGIWLGSPQQGRTTHFSLTINGHKESYNYTECDSYPCCNLSCNHTCNVDITGCGVCSIYNVNTSDIKTGTNYIDYWMSEQNYQLSLLVIYENESMPEIQYWVKDGGQIYNDKDDPVYEYFNETDDTGRIYTGSIESLKLWLHGWPHCVGADSKSGYPTLNGNELGAPDHVYSYDVNGNVHAGVPPGKEYTVFARWDNITPEYITRPSNLLRLPNYYNDRLMVSVLMLKYYEPSNLTVTDISPESLCVNHWNVINATVVNYGATARSFNVTLYAENATGSTKVDVEKVTNFSQGESKVVRFLWKPTATGQYTLNVTADVENVVKETNETNNTKTQSVTVGTATAPQWQSQSSNVSTIPNGGSIELWAQGNATVGLDYAVLCTNETGTWVNHTNVYGSPEDLDSYISHSTTHTTNADWKAQAELDNVSVIGDDVKLYRMVGTTNLASGKPAYADSYLNNNDQYAPGEAVDGVATSSWASDEVSAKKGWWYVNLSAIKDVQQIKIDFREELCGAPYKYKVDVSNANNTNWVKEIERSVGHDETFDDLDWSCRYIRVNVSDALGCGWGGNYYIAIAEFEAYGPGDYKLNGTLTSKTIETELPIASVTPTWNVTNSTNTSISVNISVDNGATWTSATNNTELTWDAYDDQHTKLKYNVSFNSTNVNETPVLHDITLNYKTRDPVEDTWLWSNFTWHNSSITDKTVGWKIYYNDTLGQTNCTDVETFSVGGHVYDFNTGAGTDKWAYKKQIPPTGPNEIFSSDDYDKIKTDNQDRKESVTDADGKYAAHRFNFSIDEAAADIEKINVTWNGIGDHDSLTDGAKLYIYNFSSTAYEQLDSATTSPPDEMTLTGERTSSISSYINANNVTVLVNQTSAQTTAPPPIWHRYSHIKTDYVKLVITPE
jgi:hypothetical protein